MHPLSQLVFALAAVYLVCHAQGEVGTFYIISDIHLDPLYDLTASIRPSYCRVAQPNVSITKQYCESQNPPKYGCFGKYMCDSPLSLLQSVADEMQTRNSKPDWILLGGDLAGHNLPTADLAKAALNVSCNELRKRFPGIPTVVTPGNNDFYPRYSVNVSMGAWLKVLAATWRDYIPADSLQSFLDGGYYVYHNIAPKLNVVSLNSVVFSPNFGPYPPPNPSIQETQFQWLEKTLQETAASGNRAYIVAHIPPATVEWRSEIQWHKQYITRYLQILDKNNGVVAGQFFSHTHHDDFRVDITPGGQLISYLITPSLSAIQNTNPTFRLVMYNSTTLVPFDYVQYYTELYAATSVLSWNVEYDFDAAYLEDSLDPETLMELFHRLQADPTLFAEYEARYSSLFNADRGRFLCTIRHINRDDFEACIASLPPGQNPVPMASASASF